MGGPEEDSASAATRRARAIGRRAGAAIVQAPGREAAGTGEEIASIARTQWNVA
jgi:hypothetical protein